MVDSDYSLNCDIVELAFLLKSVGFQMKSFEFGKNGNAEMKDIEVDIHCKASGFKSKFVLASTKCTCPPKPAENNNSLWEVQGIAPTTPEKKSLVHETACTILPPITKKAAIFARETFQMLLREYRNGIGGYEKSGATTDPKISPRQNEDHSPLNNGNCDVSTKFFSTPLHSTETVQVSSSDNPIMNNIPQIVLQDQNQNDKILLDGQERAVEPLPIKEETGDRIYSPKNVLFQSPSFEKINQESDRDIYVIEKTNECVQVVVRCRPISKKEIACEGSSQVVVAYPPRGVIEILNPNEANKENRKMFTYDAVYDHCSTQKNIYDEVVRPLVASVLEGFNCCVFAYGQTGTGKTFTMEGVRGDEEHKGIIPRTFEQIWSHINRAQNMNFLVAVSYLEIYMEELRDLLKPNSKSLELREREKTGVYVPNLHSVMCKSVEDMVNVMTQGNKNRTVGFTNMNEHSSRSHAIFMIKIEMCDIGSTTIEVGKLNLIDLAGSERQSKTGATAERLKEASKINLALSSLGNVISALAESSPHIPYRDSKLTRLLQDSLGGNSKTIMIANIGPSSFNYNETLTTLRYATRAKTIQNKPIKNEDTQDAKLKEYQEEIARLRQLIADRQKTERIPVSKKVKAVIKRKIKAPIQNGVDPEDDEEEEEDESDKNAVIALDTESKEALERERVITVELASKLNELEGQLVRGGRNILDTYTERQVELEKRLGEIADRKKREVEMQQQLELQEETTLEIRETVTSLEQEVELKTRKLSKCYTKYLAFQQELCDTKNEHNRDLRELEMTQNELVKELKRLLLIIDNFVPVEVKNRLYTHARYDEEQEEWKLSANNIHDNTTMRRPISCSGRRRPVSEYAVQEGKKNSGDSVRYKGENIVNYELDMPCRTTHEYQSPKVSASLQAVLAEAMQTDDDIDITDNGYNNSIRNRLDRIINQNAAQSSSQNGIRNIKSSKTESNKRHSAVKKPASAYPKARGLVNK